MPPDVSPSPLDKPRTGRALLIALLLALATAAVFWPAIKFEFLIYDDHDYVTGNPAVQQGLRSETLRWALTTGHAGNWHPVTWLSHALDCQLFGLDPARHHRTNILLHSLNAALLFLLLYRWTGFIGRSLFVAALFAWHPLRVESVAWIAERKDLLSGFFFFLTLLAYTRYARLRTQLPKFTAPLLAWYAATLILFTLGLLSKPMLVTVPCLLLLLDAWPLRRWTPFAPGWLRNIGRLGLEKIPFLLLVVISCIVTYHVQKAGGAISPLGLGTRLANVPVAYTRYLTKLVFPADLAILYPYPPVSAEDTLLTGALLLVISVLLVRAVRRHLPLGVGWFWFLGMLVPVIGLIQVGNQPMADRYTYLPAIGLLIMLGFGLPELLARWRSSRGILLAAALTAGVAVIPVTRSYLKVWRSTSDLFRYSMSATRPSKLALRAMGVDYLAKQQFTEARACFEQCLRGDPDDLRSKFMLGWALVREGSVEEGLTYLRPALAIPPVVADAPSYTELALILWSHKQSAIAAQYFRKALACAPNQISALNNLAWLLATAPEDSLRDGAEAVRLAQRACELTDHRAPIMLGTLAAAYAEIGRFPDAIATAEKGLALAEANKLDDIVKRAKELLTLYRAGKPFRDLD